MSTDKPTCGDCKHFDDLAGDDNRPCLVPLPFWVSPRSPCWPWRGDERAGDCRCFERKGYAETCGTCRHYNVDVCTISNVGQDPNTKPRECICFKRKDATK